MGNVVVQNKPHNKRLIHKYIEKLFDTTFNKYLNLNPKDKYVRPCSVISMTSPNYILFTRFWSN